MNNNANPLNVQVDDEIVLKGDKKSYIVKNWSVNRLSMQFFVIRKTADQYQLGIWIPAEKVARIVKKNNE